MMMFWLLRRSATAAQRGRNQNGQQKFFHGNLRNSKNTLAQH
jgi:hypothetical protein